MNLKDFNDEFQENLKANGFSINKKDSSDIMKIFIETITEQLILGKEVVIPSFAKFTTKFYSKEVQLPTVPKGTIADRIIPKAIFSVNFKKKLNGK